MSKGWAIRMAYVVRGHGDHLSNDECICVIILDDIEDAALGHVFAKYGRLMPELDSLAKQMADGS